MRFKIEGANELVSAHSDKAWHHGNLDVLKNSMWDLDRDGVTQSMLTTWLQCPEKFKLSYCSGLELAKFNTEIFDYGSFQHGILDCVYSEFKRLVDHNIDTLPFLESIEDFTRKACIFYDEYKRAELERQGFDIEALGLVKIAKLAYEIMPRYFAYWKQRDFVETEWVDLEKIFTVIFNHRFLKRPIKLRGKYDGVKRKNTRKHLRESKTKTRVDMDTISSYLSLDLQTMFYLTTMKIEYGELPTCVEFDVIKKSELKVKTTENLNDYANRVGDEVDRDPGKFFSRVEGHVSATDLKEFEDELASKLAQFQSWVDGEFHYRNTVSCLGIYRPCDFLQFCGNGREDLYKRREGLFRELRVFGQ